jgi:hypothetical protein
MRILTEHTDALFSHGICPDCLVKVMPANRSRLKTGKRLGVVERPAADGERSTSGLDQLLFDRLRYRVQRLD